MNSIPQANQLNPALGHSCRIYISLPVISSVRFSIRNTGFGFHDVFYKGSGTNSENYYLDLEKLDNKLKPINYSLLNTDIDLLGAGFPVRDWYITFGISSHISMQLSYPSDIVDIKDANLDATSGISRSINIRNLAINSSAWNSFGISASKEVSEGFRIGARLKYLNGMANIHTSRSAFDLSSTQNPLTLQAGINYKIKSSFPLEPGYASDGHVNSINFKPALDNLVNNFILTGNHGMSIDAGLTYDIDDETQLSASFTDLGFIYWKENLNTFTVDKNISFSQTDIAQYINSNHQDDFAKALADSLGNFINASASPKGYITFLPLNLYGGITRTLSPIVNAGAMTWIEINSGHIRPSMTLSLNFTPVKVLSVSVSYTLMNHKFNQIGTGLALGNRGAQFYIVTDNIVTRYVNDANTTFSLPYNAKILPYNARMLCLRFGMNLIFGCKDKKKGNASATRHAVPKMKTRDNCPAYW
jgi:hypothetical protein